MRPDSIDLRNVTVFISMEPDLEVFPRIL